MVDFPIIGKGECKTCIDVDNCPINIMLPKHKANVEIYGKHYEDKRPDLWEEEFSKIDSEFKEDLKKLTEIHCYFLINTIGGMTHAMNRNLAHGRIDVDAEGKIKINEDMYNLKIKQIFVILQLTRFGVENPTKGAAKNYVSTDDYWRWFNWWDEYTQKTLTVREWAILEDKINNGDDVSAYRPGGDWKNPQSLDNSVSHERLRKLGI